MNRMNVLFAAVLVTAVPALYALGTGTEAKGKKVVCTGLDASQARYTLEMSGLSKEGGNFSAVVTRDSKPVFSGEMIVFQQAIGIDPVTGQKFELNKYWTPKADIMIQLNETNLLTAVLLRPEKIDKLVCQAAD